MGPVGNLDPPPVSVDDRGHDQVGGHQRGPVDAVVGGRGGRAGEMQPGVAGQSQLGCRAREPTADALLVTVLDRDAQLGRCLGVGGCVGLVRADELGVEGLELSGAAEGVPQ